MKKHYRFQSVQQKKGVDLSIQEVEVNRKFHTQNR